MLKTMLKRTVTGLILLGVVLLVLYIGSFGTYGFIAFDMLLFVAIAIATIEMYRVMKKKFNPFLVPIILVIVIIYPIQFVFEKFLEGKGFSGVMICAVIGFLSSILIFIFAPNKNANSVDSDNSDEEKREVVLQGRNFEDLISTLFVLLYPLLISSMVFVSNIRLGFLPLLLVMGVSLMSDAFAYFVGSIFRGPKIFPNISPKKTYSGCIGGLIGGVAGALAIYAVFEVAGYPTYIIFTFTEFVEEAGWGEGWAIGFYCIVGFVLAILSELGDLCASAIKRRFGVKDYSTLLGTHGGVMDRIDSIIFAFILLIPFMVALAGN